MPTYSEIHSKYCTTKPVRGTTLVPLAGRREHQKQIIRIPPSDSDPSSLPAYALRFHKTDCIIYYPDGTIAVQCGGHHTLTTAKFLTQWLPLGVYAFRKNNRMWLRDANDSGPVNYPVPDKPRLFRMLDGAFVPVEPRPYQVRQIERTVTRAINAELKPFFDWARVILGMSDGWIMHETRKEVFGVEETGYGDRRYKIVEHIPHALRNLHWPVSGAKGACEIVEWYRNLKEDDYPLALCLVASQFDPRHQKINGVEWRLSSDKGFFDIKVPFFLIKRKLQDMVRRSELADKIVDVMPDDKIRELA